MSPVLRNVLALIRRRASFCLAIFVGLSSAVLGAERVSVAFINEDVSLRILEKKTDGAATLYAIWTNCTEATITVAMTLDNAYASGHLPLTVDSKGQSSVGLVTVRPIDLHRSWSYRYQHFWQPGRRGNVVTNAFSYHLPYLNETHRVIQADFGRFSHQAGSGDEHAIDWAMPIGTSICAARDGTVVALRQDSDVGGANPKYRKAQNYVILRHDDDTFAEYCHLKQNGVLVRLGQKVKAGEPIGFSGDTGFRSGPHLHFAVFQTVDGQTRRSLPVRFKTVNGEVESLKENQTY